MHGGTGAGWAATGKSAAWVEALATGALPNNKARLSASADTTVRRNPRREQRSTGVVPGMAGQPGTQIPGVTLRAPVGGRARSDAACEKAGVIAQAPTIPRSTVTTSGASAAIPYPMPAARKAVLAFSTSPGSPPAIT